MCRFLRYLLVYLKLFVRFVWRKCKTKWKSAWKEKNYFDFFYEDGIQYTGNPKGKSVFKETRLCPVALKKKIKKKVSPTIRVTEVYGELYEIFECAGCPNICRLQISTSWKTKEWERVKKIHRLFKIRTVMPM